MAAGIPNPHHAVPAHMMRRRSTDRKPATGNLPVLQGASYDHPTSFAYTRPDPSFVAHLIATAERSPQTRTLRRADSVDVDAAYRATTSHKPASAVGTTRAVI